MSRKNEKDYLYLIWKDPISRRNFIVGQLSKNSQYEFSYGHEVKKAIEKGFELLIPFDDIDKVYKSDTLFPTFSSRLPDSKRRGIEKILAKYDLTNFDEYKLLKKSGAKLPIDTLEFIDPIPEKPNGKVKRVFYIAGVRHCIGCDGYNCEKNNYLNLGDQLSLELEPTNEYDENAIKILDKQGSHVGYIPRYYSKGVIRFLKNGATYEVKVVELNKDMQCQECIRVKLELSINTKQITMSS
ncbi:hypothetical protein SYNTR_0917 [Candidatus Syntrophocurvum alkaliphilum]|uniref:HIRAN domain-containing protein n=1 Tax=Candidatus Syntrophocurvum alkaliphilum TaxID=2293317 RepID=A0A6I6DGI9_9FIRM|nr:HIRAN domain-containing protein [Candidatus Syntrophocurvum alkaliphilum]QGT99510.1 hypothetical protein SYNTR_0917 [Candidatus Syntrophocurvum alkaliphilum]